MGKSMRSHLTEGDTEMANKHMRCSASLSVREMQIKTTMTRHCMPMKISEVSLLLVKKTPNAGKQAEAGLPLLGGMQHGIDSLERSLIAS